MSQLTIMALVIVGAGGLLTGGMLLAHKYRHWNDPVTEKSRG